MRQPRGAEMLWCCCMRSYTPHTLRPQDSATAKKLAFDKNVERRCVTLEGDDFNPKGLLTGGARQQVRRLAGCELRL